jgi:membrane protein
MRHAGPALAVLKDAWRAFASQGGRLLAGAIAYSALISILPLFVLIVRVAALFTGEAKARATLLKDVARWVGPQGAETLGDMLARAERGGAHTTIVGACVLVWGATRLFGAVRRSLDVLWGTSPSLDDTMKNKAERFLEHRLRGFAFALVIGVGLVGLSFAHAALGMIREISPNATMARVSGTVGEVALSLIATSLMFAGIFRVLPSKAIPVVDAAIGGVLTSALFTTGGLLAGAYIGYQASRSPFGAATSIVLLLVWVHYSAHAFLFGAAVTAARAKRKGVL